VAVVPRKKPIILDDQVFLGIAGDETSSFFGTGLGSGKAAFVISSFEAPTVSSS
jgi:hypothetical protein